VSHYPVNGHCRFALAGRSYALWFADVDIWSRSIARFALDPGWMHVWSPRATRVPRAWLSHWPIRPLVPFGAAVWDDNAPARTK
jgi:hypothetical protein